PERWRYTLEPEGSRPEERRIEGVAVAEPEDRGARKFWISERQNGKGATGPEAEQQRGRQPAARKSPGQAGHHGEGRDERHADTHPQPQLPLAAERGKLKLAQVTAILVSRSQSHQGAGGNIVGRYMVG